MSGIDVREAPAATRLEDLIHGYQHTQVLVVAARLGLADRLAAGPQRTEALAPALGADPRGLYRLMRGLEHLGLLHEPSPGLFALTGAGQRLRSDAPDTVHDELILIGRTSYAWWGALEHCVRTGESSVPAIEGMASFEVLHRDPDLTARFNRMMSAMVGAMAKGVVAAWDFSRFGTIVDVGGGRGTLLAAILEAHPTAKGVLFDVPATADEARDAIAARGLADRCACVGGDFFASVPSGDVILLSAVISDWDDDKSVAILSNVRRALAPGGRVLLIERLLDPDAPAPQSAFMDLQMLVIGGGTGRTAGEYRRLLEAAGLELVQIVPTGTARSLFESRHAGTQ